MTDTEKLESDDDSTRSVVDRVLIAFTKAVGEEDGYGDIAIRLKATVLDERDLSEAALERALFEVEQS